MNKNGTLEKCETCKIAHETPDMACCAWYMDNVVCGDKTTEDCTDYIPCDNEGAEWISVEERLPDLYGTYLVYTYDNHIKLGYFCELVIGLPPAFDDYAVTHWMPLPEPPKL